MKCSVRARLLGAGVAIACAAAAAAPAASTAMIKMPTVQREAQQQRQAAAAGHATATGIYPSAPPCPESGLLPKLPGPVQFSNCGLPETPATTLPYLTPMAYWGGPVQTQPKEYLVLWGWDQTGAFGSQPCGSPETITEGSLSATLNCDPDGAGKYMADFLKQMGATNWAEVQDQYFQKNADGSSTNIDESSPNLLAGIWVDDTNPADLSKTNATNPAGSGNTYSDLALEAQRAAAHFGVSGTALTNANFIIAQPPAFTDPNAINSGYCAFHDYTDPSSPGNFYYNVPGLASNIVYTNMPYQLAINIGGQNACGENAVNQDARGKLDGFSIVLGHEVQETATDPGAESIDGNILNPPEVYHGGWYDALDANENGDKCAWVGEPITAVLGLPGSSGGPTPIPGALGNIQGNAGDRFAAQSLWSNAALLGLGGYCAGVPSTDLPGPLAGEPPY